MHLILVYQDPNGPNPTWRKKGKKLTALIIPLFPCVSSVSTLVNPKLKVIGKIKMAAANKVARVTGCSTS